MYHKNTLCKIKILVFVSLEWPCGTIMSCYSGYSSEGFESSFWILVMTIAIASVTLSDHVKLFWCPCEVGVLQELGIMCKMCVVGMWCMTTWLVKVGCLGKERGCFLAVSPSNRCTPFFRDMHSVDCFVVLFGRKNKQIVNWICVVLLCPSLCTRTNK